MFNKLVSFICIVLVLSLTSSTYGLVIGNWEDSNDGWDIWSGAPNDTTIDYNDTIGVTLDSNSLKLYVPESGEQDVLVIRLYEVGLTEIFKENDTFSLDVSWVTSEWSGGNWAQIQLVVNADDGVGWQNLGQPDTDTSNPGYPGGWDPVNFGDSDTRTVTWNYGNVLSGHDPNWAELIIKTVYDANFTTGGIYYLDNAQLYTRTYDAVIGDWEDANDVWIDWGNQLLVDDPTNMPSKYNYSTDWSSLGDTSLKLTHAGWNQNLSIKLQDAGHVDDFMNNTKFLIDLHIPATTESGWLKIEEILLNAEGADWGDYKVSAPIFVGWGEGGGGATDVTLEFDYSAYLSDPDVLALGRNPNWVEFIIATNNDGEETGVHMDFYFDNARLAGGPKAMNPNPDDEAVDVEANPVLKWTPNAMATSHEIYIGTDFNDVSEANSVSHPNVDYNTVDVNRYEPGMLEFNTTYYWRVDEVGDGEFWQGQVWSFTTGEHLVVDNMDDYGDNVGSPWEPGDRIYYVWRDGWDISVSLPGNDTGSQVYHWNDEGTGLMESTIVRSGVSMPYYYENDGDNQSKPYPYDNPDNPLQYYSEASAKTTGPNSLEFTEDWTIMGVEGLVLWFYGDPNNDATSAEQLYVALEDGDGHIAVVPYDGDMNDITQQQWHEWGIALSAFDGVDLTDVQKLYIGFGNRDNPQFGGSGIVYFDDIMLYTSKCFLSSRSPDFAKADYAPAGNPGGDCMINYQEIEMMGRDWLVEDDVVTPTQDPGTTGLVAYFPFDEGEGSVANDVSVNDHNGTLSAAGVTWVLPGLMGDSAVNIDRSGGARISLGTWDPTEGTGVMTLSAWVRWSGPMQADGEDKSQGIISKRDGWSSDGLMFMFEVDTPGTDGALALRQYSTSVYTAPGTMLPLIGKWAHVAATFDGSDAVIYLNGRAIGSGSFSFADGTDAGLVIGNTNSDSWPGCPESFNGDIDEVRIYNRTLSSAEVAYLADLTPGDDTLYIPVPSPAEIYDAEVEGSRKVNFRDFAVLAEMWLFEEQWP